MLCFRCTTKWFSYIYTCICSFSIFSHLVYYRILNTVSCANSGSLLVIYFKYNSVFMSRSNSQPFLSSIFFKKETSGGFFCSCFLPLHSFPEAVSREKYSSAQRLKTEDRRKILGKMNEKHFQNIIITPREIAARIFSQFCPWSKFHPPSFCFI